MSLCRGGRCGLATRFPRVSGDEPPFGSRREPFSLFSPRERG